MEKKYKTLKTDKTKTMFVSKTDTEIKEKKTIKSTSEQDKELEKALLELGRKKNDGDFILEKEKKKEGEGEEEEEEDKHNKTFCYIRRTGKDDIAKKKEDSSYLKRGLEKKYKEIRLPNYKDIATKVVTTGTVNAGEYNECVNAYKKLITSYKEYIKNAVHINEENIKTYNNNIDKITKLLIQKKNEFTTLSKKHEATNTNYITLKKTHTDTVKKLDTIEKERNTLQKEKENYIITKTGEAMEFQSVYNRAIEEAKKKIKNNNFKKKMEEIAECHKGFGRDQIKELIKDTISIKGTMSKKSPESIKYKQLVEMLSMIFMDYAKQEETVQELEAKIKNIEESKKSVINDEEYQKLQKQLTISKTKLDSYSKDLKLLENYKKMIEGRIPYIKEQLEKQGAIIENPESPDEEQEKINEADLVLSIALSKLTTNVEFESEIKNFAEATKQITQYSWEIDENVLDKIKAINIAECSLNTLNKLKNSDDKPIGEHLRVIVKKFQALVVKLISNSNKDIKCIKKFIQRASNLKTAVQIINSINNDKVDYKQLEEDVNKIDLDELKETETIQDSDSQFAKELKKSYNNTIFFDNQTKKAVIQAIENASKIQEAEQIKKDVQIASDSLNKIANHKSNNKETDEIKDSNLKNAVDKVQQSAKTSKKIINKLLLINTDSNTNIDLLNKENSDDDLAQYFKDKNQNLIKKYFKKIDSCATKNKILYKIIDCMLGSKSIDLSDIDLNKIIKDDINEAQDNDFNNQAKETVTKINDLVKSNQDLTEKNTDLGKKNENLETVVKSITSISTATNNNKESVTTAISGIEGDNICEGVTKDNIITVAGNVDELVKSKNNLEKENQDLGNKVNDLESEKQILEQKNQDLEQENKKLKESNEKINGIISQALEQVKSNNPTTITTTPNDQTQANINDIIEVVANLKKYNQQLLDDQKQLQEKIMKLNSENEKLKQQVFVNNASNEQNNNDRNTIYEIFKLLQQQFKLRTEDTNDTQTENKNDTNNNNCTLESILDFIKNNNFQQPWTPEKLMEQRINDIDLSSKTNNIDIIFKKLMKPNETNEDTDQNTISDEEKMDKIDKKIKDLQEKSKEVDTLQSRLIAESGTKDIMKQMITNMTKTFNITNRDITINDITTSIDNNNISNNNEISTIINSHDLHNTIKTHNQLVKSKNNLEKENQNLTDKNTDLDNKVNDLENNKQILETVVKSITKVNTATNNNKESVTTAISGIEGDNICDGVTKDNIITVAGNVDELVKSKNNLEKENQDLGNKVNDLESDKQILEQKNQDLGNKVNDLESEKQELETKTGQYSQLCEKINNLNLNSNNNQVISINNCQISDDLDKVNSKIEGINQLAKSNQDLKDQNTDLDNKVNDLENNKQILETVVKSITKVNTATNNNKESVTTAISGIEGDNICDGVTKDNIITVAGNVDELVKSKNNLEKENQDLGNKVNDLESEKQELETKTGQYSQLCDRINNLNLNSNNNQVISINNCQISDDLDKVNSKIEGINQLVKSNQDLTEKNTDLGKKNENLETVVKSITSISTATNNNKESVTTAISGIEGDNICEGVTKDNIITVAGNVDELVKSKNNLEKENQDLGNKVNDLESEKQILEQKNQDLGNKVNDLESEKQELETKTGQYSQLCEKINNLNLNSNNNQEIEINNCQIEDLDGINSKIEGINQLVKSNQDLTEKNTDLGKKNENLETVVKSITSISTATNNNKESVTTAISGIEGDNICEGVTKDNIITVAGNVDELVKSKNNLEKENQDLGNKVNDLENNNRDLKTQNDQYKTVCNAIKTLDLGVNSNQEIEINNCQIEDLDGINSKIEGINQLVKSNQDLTKKNTDLGKKIPKKEKRKKNNLKEQNIKLFLQIYEELNIILNKDQNNLFDSDFKAKIVNFNKNLSSVTLENVNEIQKFAMDLFSKVEQTLDGEYVKLNLYSYNNEIGKRRRYY